MRSRTRSRGVHPGGHAPPTPPAPATSPLPARPVPTAVFTAADYERALGAFLDGGTRLAVEAAGFGPVQARHLIHVGIPHLNLQPLTHAARELAARTDKLTAKMVKAAAEDDAQATARALEERRAVAEKVRARETAVLGNAAESREQEMKLVQANRTTANVLARIGVDLLHTASALAQDLRHQATTGALKALSPEKKLGLVRNVATIAARTAEVSQRAVQMERLLMGEPTTIIGGVSPAADMTPEEAEKWFALADRAFRRRAARTTAIDVQGTPVDESDLLEPGEEHHDGA